MLDDAVATDIGKASCEVALIQPLALKAKWPLNQGQVASINQVRQHIQKIIHVTVH